MKSKVKKALFAAYCLGMTAFIVWLAFSTSWIAGAINGEGVLEVDFADIQDKYLKDYVFCCIDDDQYEGGMFERFSIEGWALCDTTENTFERYSSLILCSSKHSYEIMLFPVGRLDVPVVIPMNLNRPDMKISGSTGFARQFSLLGIKDGVYDLYLCCWENETNHGMSDTFTRIIKHGNEVEIVPWSTEALEAQVAATREEESLGFLDKVSVADGMVTASGWEFAQEMDSAEQSVYIEFTDSRGNSTEYPAKMTSRTDVANAYGDQRYAQSGYMTVFPADGFKDDTYSVRVFVENGGDVWCSKHYTVIKAGDDIAVMQY